MFNLGRPYQKPTLGYDYGELNFELSSRDRLPRIT